jgi:ABC-type amino acid transport substrate-binding protein
LKCLGNVICAEAKLKCSWVETSFDSLIPASQARKDDVALKKQLDEEIVKGATARHSEPAGKKVFW